MIKNAILVQRVNKETGTKQWALISKKKPHRVLKWFGAKKPSKERVQKEEKRIQFFKRQSDRMEHILKLSDISGDSDPVGDISFPEEKEDLPIIIEADDATRRTAESLFKIIQFLFYRVPAEDKRKFFSRLKGKVIKLSPDQLGIKKMPPSSVIGQSLAISRNILSGLNPIFVKRVLEELVVILSQKSGLGE